MQWNFYQDSDGTWAWELWDIHRTLRGFGSGFATADEAEKDAAKHGYRPPPRDWKVFP
jgi:hypothetical protein